MFRRKFRWAAGLALAAAVCSTGVTGQAGPVPAQPQLATALQHYSTADTPVSTLLADPAALEILRRHAPVFANSSRAAMLGNDSLKAIQGYAHTILTDEVLARIDAEFAKLPAVRLPVPAATTDEARVRPYTLPDPLVLANGKRVVRPAQWWRERRPQILAMFETLEFGRAPARPSGQHFEVFERGAPAFGGKALRSQVLIHVARDPAAPKIQLVKYLPANARGPVPMVLMIGFSAPSAMIDDPGIRPSLVWDPAKKQKVAARPSPMGKFDPRPFLDAGFGVTTYYYGDLDPDFRDGYALGIRGYLANGQPRAADAWGAIGAWAWSLSRVQDYLETDRAVDAKRVALIGASRLGKTVLWAAARDQRFAAVIACCSGKMGGAALMRRNFGSTIAGSAPGESDFWLAENFRQFHHNEDRLPMDSHMLLSLIAPRPVLLQTGKYDHAADPKGEFLSGVAATPVYRLLGKQGLDGATWPPAGPILNDLGYTMNSGGHGVQPSDWGIYLQFLQKHLR